MPIDQIIGFIAGVCTTIAFLPQALKVIKTRKTRDISLWMYIIFITGVACWLVYGVMITQYPVIIANGATLILAFIVLIYKIIYK